MIKNVSASIWLMKRSDGKCSGNHMDEVGKGEAQ
jgi:hypothetical protein